MTRAYTLDPKAAADADNFMSRLDRTGKYTGTLIRAEAKCSDNKTDGIEFSFRADSGGVSDYLSIWTHNASGEALAGLKTLNAIMTVCRVKAITPTQGLVERWDRFARQREKVSATIFPELTGKRIGLLLQREEYDRNDGGTGVNMRIFAPFDPETELTASEILAKKTNPEVLPRMVAQLKDRPPQRFKSAAPAEAAATKYSGGFDDIDQDIPF